MFSPNRNTAAAIKAAPLVVGTLLLATANVRADGEHHPLVLTAFINGAGGPSLVAGKYDAALGEIQHGQAPLQNIQDLKVTNLCVAYTALRRWEQAKRPCDAAVTAAKADKQRAASGPSASLTDENAYVAIAYTNRAVLHWLTRDADSAKADLDRAQSLAPQADFVVRNLAAVGTARTVAQLDVSPR